jgi:predicted nucleic acid-binding Zn ribbon protein
VKKARTPETIGSIISSVLGERGYLSPCRELEGMRQWPDLVGEKVASVSECTRVDNGVLFVRIASSSWRHEVSYIKKQILDTIKKETPCNTIRDIVFF